MQKNNWNKIILEDFLEFNPKIQLKKGVVSRKVDMDKLEPFTRKIIGSQSACFTGGSKFANYDTLVARITPCLENGKTAYVDILEKGKVAFGSTEFIVLRAKENISDSLFIYYLAISPQFREKAISLMSGTSGRQRVDVNALKTLSFDLPPLEAQKRIAEVLGAFDDKIELLQKQNKTLEDMAKAIFKSWFADFDVVKAKQRGDSKANIMREYHLTEELYDLFPSSFEGSSLGPIPTGWEVKMIQDLAKVVAGGTPSTKESSFFAPSGTAVAWLTPKDLSGYPYKYISCGQTDITQAGLDNSSAQLMPANSIVFSSRAPIGYIAISSGQITTNQGFKSLVPYKVYYTEFLYHYLCYNKYMIENLGTGSTFKEVSGSVMKGIPLYVPNEKILEKFENHNAIINTKLKNNQKQIQTLTELRDSLLPRLISGKIRV